MRVAVKHNLEVLGIKREDGSTLEDFKMPIREAEAVMGETIDAYLARVAWRFDLPTICLIDGEYYGRAEWPVRHLAVNDNVEFVSRPLGSGSGGSTAKSIGAVVALIALTAVAPGLGTSAAGALLFGGGSAAGGLASLISATIVGAAAVPVAAWLVPRVSWWRRTLAAARTSLRGAMAVACRIWRPWP